MSKRITDKCLLRDLQRVAKQLGKNAVTRKEYNEHGTFSSTTLMRHFDTWSIALDKAGLEQTLRQNIAAEEILKDAERVRKILNKANPTREEYLKHGKFSVKPIVRHFGTWSNFLRGYKLAIEDRELQIECSEDLENKRFQNAIVNASVVLEERLRSVCGRTAEVEGMVGVRLVDYALKQGSGKLFVSKISAEQDGVHKLFRGAFQFVRNPPSHKRISYTDFEAWHAVGLIDYLLFLLKQAKRQDE